MKIHVSLTLTVLAIQLFIYYERVGGCCGIIGLKHKHRPKKPTTESMTFPPYWPSNYKYCIFSEEERLILFRKYDTYRIFLNRKPCSIFISLPSTELSGDTKPPRECKSALSCTLELGFSSVTYVEFKVARRKQCIPRKINNIIVIF